jgi:hypothetical protein
MGPIPVTPEGGDDPDMKAVADRARANDGTSDSTAATHATDETHKAVTGSGTGDSTDQDDAQPESTG